MSDTYLKPRPHYEELYDKGTVESCRRMSKPTALDTDNWTDPNFDPKNATPEQIKKMEEVKKGWAGTVSELAVWMYAAERYNNKSKVIEEWIKKDREHDERIAKIQPPLRVLCRKCYSAELELEHQHEVGWGEKRPRHQMLFMYRCRECSTVTGFYENGQEYEVKPTLCPECGSERQTFTKDEEEHKHTIHYVCSACSHKWDDVLDLTPLPPEQPDPDFEKDRNKFCHSKKVREWAESMQRIRHVHEVLNPNAEEKKAQEELQQALAQIKRLTVAQVKAELDKAIAKEGYGEFQLGQPEMGKQVVVPFNVMDDKDRSADDSRHGLYKLISKHLDGTNWQLVRSSLTYRMGYIAGKIKGYESDEDIRQLFEKQKPKTS